MILIDSTELMAPGETFELYFQDWHRILHPPMGPTAYSNGKAKVQCEVLKVFLRSSREVRYLCRKVGDRNQFVLGQILEPAYQVTATHPSLTVSALVIEEAASRIGVRSISPEKPTLYTQEDATRLAQAIEDTPVKERHGYLIPDFESAS